MKCLTDSAIELTWPGVPVTACASMRPCAVEDAGREVAGLAHDGREGGAQQRLRLLLDHGDQPVPHDLQFDVADRLGHDRLSGARVCFGAAPHPDPLPASGRGSTQLASARAVRTRAPPASTVEVEARRHVGRGAVLHDQGGADQGRSGRQVVALEHRHREAAAEAGIENRSLARWPWARACRRLRQGAWADRWSVVASTSQLMISISALGMWRANRRVYSRSKSARKVAASAGGHGRGRAAPP